MHVVLTKLRSDFIAAISSDQNDRTLDTSLASLIDKISGTELPSSRLPPAKSRSRLVRASDTHCARMWFPCERFLGSRSTKHIRLYATAAGSCNPLGYNLTTASRSANERYEAPISQLQSAWPMWPSCHMPKWPI